MTDRVERPKVADDAAFVEKARLLRPFYFIVVVWGERYVDFLCNFCIAALLSPNNIPALHNRGKNKFLIATTDEDWERMQSRPIFKLLAEYVEPVRITIPPLPEEASACVHMGIGHKIATQIAFEARAYSVLLTPDLMVSDGTMAAAQRHAVAGIQVVLTAALRFGEEPLFKHLEEIGLPGIDSRLGDEGRPLVATGRQFVKAGIRSFHSETLRYEWGTPYFSTFPVACWWRVPDQDGIVVHSLSWAPLLVDYDAVEHHDNSMMDHWTIDGDYVYKNFGMSGRVHVVQDSDEMMLVSWAPLADREQSLEPLPFFATPILGNVLRSLVLHSIYSHEVFDPLKRKIFLDGVKWHSRDIDSSWDSVQQKALTSIIRSIRLGSLLKELEEPSSKASGPFTYVANIVIRSINVVARFIVALFAKYPLRLLRLINYYWSGRDRIFSVARRALKGDRAALKRVRSNSAFFVNELNGFRRKGD